MSDNRTELTVTQVQAGEEFLSQPVAADNGDAAVRVDAFIQADIPFFTTSSLESDLMEAYTPSARVGIGVGF